VGITFFSRKFVCTAVVGVASFFTASLVAVSTPVGSGPDDWFHLVGTYCSHGTQASNCTVLEQNQDNGMLTLEVPSELLGGNCGSASKMEAVGECSFATNVGESRKWSQVSWNSTHNPSLIYYLSNLVIIEDNVRDSALWLRIISTFIFSGLLTILLVLAPIRLFFPIAISSFAGIAPLGLSLFGTNNTSVWSIIGVTFFSISSYLLLFERTSSRKWLILTSSIFILTSTLASQSRPDSATYLPMILLCMLPIILLRNSNTKQVDSLVWIGLFSASTALAYIGVRSLTVVGQVTDPSSEFAPNLRLNLFHNMLELPSFLMGPFGDMGYMNVSGLGTYDIPLPTSVRVLMTLAIGALIARALISQSFLQISTWTLVFIATCIVSMAGFAVFQTTPGGLFQPRYIAPLGPTLFFLLAIPCSSVIQSLRDDKDLRLRVLITGLPALAASISMYVLILRFSSGINSVGDWYLNHFRDPPLSYTHISNGRLQWEKLGDVGWTQFGLSPRLWAALVVTSVILWALSILQTSRHLLRIGDISSGASGNPK
jgi:hypothetical protein